MNLGVEEPAVFTTHHPVVLFREHDQPGRYLLSLQRTPELDCVVHRHPVIAFPDGHEHWRLEAAGAGQRVLLRPDGGRLPRWPAGVAFAAPDGVARSPLLRL